MTLSVLTLPELGYGLWNGNQYIEVGSEEKCYTEKHRLETLEQEQANKQWRKETMEKQVKLLTDGGLTKEHATKIVDKNLQWHRNN